MDVNVFGLSTLRQGNDSKGSEGGKKSKEEPSEKAKQLQAYLNEQYGIDSKTKKKKKKKKKHHVAQGSVAIIDGDAETSLKTLSYNTAVGDPLLGHEEDDEGMFVYFYCCDTALRVGGGVRLMCVFVFVCRCSCCGECWGVSEIAGSRREAKGSSGEAGRILEGYSGQ